MKFLTDVNASGIMAHWLTQMGHDVVKVGDKNPRMTDEEILNWALAEERIIITTDTDFEEMVWQRGFAHCGILRLENLPRIERKLLLQDTGKISPRTILRRNRNSPKEKVPYQKTIIIQYAETSH